MANFCTVIMQFHFIQTIERINVENLINKIKMFKNGMSYGIVYLESLSISTIKTCCC